MLTGESDRLAENETTPIAARLMRHLRVTAGGAPIGTPVLQRGTDRPPVPLPAAGLVSMIVATMLTRTVKSTKYQNSERRARPVKPT